MIVFSSSSLCLEMVEQAPDVVIGVREEPRVYLGHPREQPLLVVVQRVPRAGDVEHRERLAVGPRPRLIPDRVDLGQLGVGGHDAELLLVGERLLADRLVAHVELALEPVDPLLRRVVRRVAGARRVVEEERLLRHDRLRVADELERLVRDVVGEVVALLRGARLVDGVVVVDEVRVPLVRLGAEEPVPALEAAAARPVPSRRGEVHLVGRAQVPLADHVGVPAALGEDLRQHPVLGRDRPARVREPDRRLGDARHAVVRVVAPGEQAGAGRRAQRRRVELRVANALRDDPVDVRRRRSVPRSTPSPRTPRRRARCTRRSAPRQAPAAARTATSPAPSRECRR